MRLPAAFAHDVPLGLAGSSAGFSLAVQAGSNVERALLYRSADGERWFHTQPRDVGVLATQPLASYGQATYLLASTASGQKPAVWTSSDTRHWAGPTILPGSVADETLVGVMAGPKGVMAVGLNGLDFSSDPRASPSTPPPFAYEIWFSRNGRSFNPPVILYTRRGVDPFSVLLATETGFDMRASGYILSSQDGRHWGLDVLYSVSKYAEVLAYEDGWTVLIGGLKGWYQEASGPRVKIVDRSLITLFSTRCVNNACSVSGTSNAMVWKPIERLGYGRLPDLGVTPHQQVNVAYGIPGGLIAAGFSAYPYVGAVWTSSNGINWTKIPTRINAFNQTSGFDYIAQSGTHIVLVGLEVPATPQQVHGTGVWVGR